MKRLFNMLVIAGLALAAAGSAHAQVSELLGSGDIKVGIFDPSSANTRTYSANSQIAVGADYTPPGLPGARPTFYGDYEGASKNNGHVQVLGLGVAEKFEPPLVGSITKITPYAGIGIGGYSINVKNPANGQSGSSVTIGGKVFAGVSFSKWLLEANYQYLPTEKSIDPKGFGIQIGMTF
jgi:hypothetical protein